MAGSIWEQFTHDPRDQEHARLRAADRDRDMVNDVLATAYAEGRLTPEELDERTDQVAQARTLGELPAVIDDLVAPAQARTPVVPDRRAEAERRYRQQRQQALFAFLTPTLICWAVWMATMFGGFPWPVFVMIGTGMRFVQLTVTREDSIQAIERDLEKKERKRLDATRSADDRALPPGADPGRSPGKSPGRSPEDDPRMDNG
jgi:hypothetical protein